MRQISGEFLHSEITRLGAVVLQTWAYHPSGVQLHAPGDVLTAEHAAVFAKAVLDSLYLAEAGEDRKGALAAAGVIQALIDAVTSEDALAEDVAPPGSRNRYRAGTALEPAVVEALKKDKVPSVPVCRGASAASIKWARTYLELAPAAPPKAARPDPATAAAASSAWGLLTPRARVLAALPDDMARLRMVNALLAAGHEVLETKKLDEVLATAKAQRPDIVLLPAEGGAAACADLRKRGEAMRAMTVAVCGDVAKGGPWMERALEAGANDFLPLPASPGHLADRVRIWLRLRNKEVGLPLSIFRERRASERKTAALTILLSDPRSSKPLPVTSATLLEMSDGGLRLEYGLLEPPDPGAYRPHGVHPTHPLFPFAKENAAGRDLVVSLTGRNVPAFESAARVAHLALVTGSERVGLCFVRKQIGAAERVTQIVRKPLL